MSTQAAEDVQRKIQELESAQVCLKQEISKLLLSETLESEGSDVSDSAKRRYRSCYDSWKRIPPSSQLLPPLELESGSCEGQRSSGFYLNILQYMGQAVHILNTGHRIIYWNRTAEILYGYNAAEALGKNAFDLLVDFEHFDLGVNLIKRVSIGECWTGFFPIHSKRRKFTIVLTITPLYDEDGTYIGVTCASADSKSFEDMRFTLPYNWNSGSYVNSTGVKTSVSTKFGPDPDQPLQDAVTSKITDMATKVGNKVKSKLRHGKQNVEFEVNRSGYGSLKASLFGSNGELRSNVASLKENAATFFGTFSKTGELASKLFKDMGEESEGNIPLNKITSKAEAWISKKSINWPWKGNQQELSEDESHQSSNLVGSAAKSESKANECDHLAAIEELGKSSSSSLFTVSSKSNVSGISTNTSCGSVMKLDMGIDCLDYEIFSEDLTYKQQIGQGYCGTVYHGFWCGSDVAIKVFPDIDYTDDATLSFRQEVSIMKGLRHPNVLLFMGAVLSPQRLSIITEFLPRGSLFRILQRNNIYKLDWRRRINMALDIARGMNYLHCHNPPIIHRDLKSSNLLVDKNWTVMVSDFGLSRIKHETYLNMKTGKRTPQWMAPEVLRCEPSDEKCDIYSFGVVLWELATEKMPWEDLNAIQVIGAVGFRNQRLDIPSDVDPRWAAIIESCWQSVPRNRPTFEELLKKLKHLAKEYAVRHQAAKSGTVDIAPKEQCP